MTILVPPAVFDEVKAVFDLPVAANVGLQLGCRNGSRVDAGDKIPALAGENLAFGRTHFTIDANDDFARPCRTIGTFCPYLVQAFRVLSQHVVEK